MEEKNAGVMVKAMALEDSMRTWGIRNGRGSKIGVGGKEEEGKGGAINQIIDSFASLKGWARD
jgi:hypothetical protein